MPSSKFNFIFSRASHSRCSIMKAKPKKCCNGIVCRSLRATLDYMQLRSSSWPVSSSTVKRFNGRTDVNEQFARCERLRPVLFASPRTCSFSPSLRQCSELYVQVQLDNTNIKIQCSNKRLLVSVSNKPFAVAVRFVLLTREIFEFVLIIRAK